jgi:SAM-dependent methyltransferase
MASPTRWETDTDEGHSDWYVERFRKMAAEGADLVGEARLIDAMLPRGARVLDAGCGPGRHTAYLHACGHDAVGVDADSVLIDAARVDHPGPRYHVADLATLDLPSVGEVEPFDGALMAGNVIVFVAPGSETEVLRRVRAHLAPDGFLVVGFHTDRHLTVGQFDTHVEEAGFQVEHRFATWDLRPWRDDAGFAVTVLRR